MIRCRSRFYASKQIAQRYHQAVLKLPSLGAVYNQRHSKSQDDLLYQHVRHRVSTLIFNRKSLGPFTKVVSDDKDVSITVRCWVTDVKYIHRNTIPSMTGGNSTQRVMAVVGRLPLYAFYLSSVDMYESAKRTPARPWYSFRSKVQQTQNDSDVADNRVRAGSHTVYFGINTAQSR